MISMEGFSFWELKHEGKLDLFGLLESLAYRYRVRGMGLWNAFFPGQAQRQEVPEEYIQKIRNTANALGLEICTATIVAYAAMIRRNRRRIGSTPCTCCVLA